MQGLLEMKEWWFSLFGYRNHTFQWSRNQSPNAEEGMFVCVCVCVVFGYGRVVVPFIKLGWNLEPYIIKSQISWNANWSGP